MALTQTQEQALLDMLQKWTGAQERRPVKPSSLAQSVDKPSVWWHVVGYDPISSNKNLFRIPIHSVGYSLSRSDLTVPDGGGAINWSNANHLVSSKQLKAFYEHDIKAPLDRNTADIEVAKSLANAAQSTANLAKSTAEGIIPHVNSNTGAIKGKLGGWKEDLVMDFGTTPNVTGASTVTFNRQFKGAPIVIVNFWGDVGNPRFSLAESNGRTWGIRLSATYPGVWAVIGEPA